MGRFCLRSVGRDFRHLELPSKVLLLVKVDQGSSDSLPTVHFSQTHAVFDVS